MIFVNFLQTANFADKTVDVFDDANTNSTVISVKTDAKSEANATKYIKMQVY